LQARKAKVGWVLRSLLEWESGFLSILFFKFIFQKQNRYRPNSKVKNGVKKKMYPDQAILSQSIAKSCRNQLPNDVAINKRSCRINCQTVKINYQGKMSEQKMCLAPSTTPQGSALPSGLLLSIMEALKLNLVGNFQIS
jgi:hypothetical protein